MKQCYLVLSVNISVLIRLNDTFVDASVVLITT
jgi:hypothetical protein